MGRKIKIWKNIKIPLEELNLHLHIIYLDYLMFCRGIITGDRNFIVFGPFKTIFDIFGHVAGEKILKKKKKPSRQYTIDSKSLDSKSIHIYQQTMVIIFFIG